jgi:hypothetical protein
VTAKKWPRWRVYFLNATGTKAVKSYQLIQTTKEAVAIARGWHGTAIVRTADTFPGCFAARYARGERVQSDAGLWRWR